MGFDAALSFLTGTNAVFIAELYERYLRDPESVDQSWRDFFGELRQEGYTLEDARREGQGASWKPNGHRVLGVADVAEAPRSLPMDEAPPAAATSETAPQTVDSAEIRARTLDSIRALMMIRVFRVRGHLEADLDPLGLAVREAHPELDYRSYGFTEADLDREIYIDHVLGLETATLRQILEILRETYCGTIGVEFMHIQDPDQKAWIQQRIEGIHNQTQFTDRGKHAILERLVHAEGFERFLQLKYTGTKRFGLEGGETLIPALEQVLKRGSQLGIEEVVLGMPHRGRLNVLTAIMHKPYRAMFSEFQGNPANPEDVQGSGDVKYHLGTSADRDFDGAVVHLSLSANPSHLEAVNPVVLGKVRAKQALRGDSTGDRVMAVLVHGDAAFAGQGVVAECFGLSGLAGYTTGGCVHIVVNNQIGFTTTPEYARSGTYCTEIAKMVQAPIFHVNGDDPEAVVHVARIATEFRQQFKIDVVIDMVCYRRHGHNEGDEPAFTQPTMYRRIAKHPTTRQVYARRLVENGALTEEEADRMVADFHEMLEREFEASATYKPNKADWLEGRWKGISRYDGEEEPVQQVTGVATDLLKTVGEAISREPEGFNVNRKVVRQLKAKRQMIETGVGIDWATGEALAFGTLLAEGHPVRLAGQDSSRGTFSQRHSVLVDQDNEDKYVPLNNISADQARFEVIDSFLSEYAALGFEYGYTLPSPNTLVMWEAQFGDFANGAQIVFDQFISSAESKWLRMSGLTVLLPHGYEGQGPEHSSARLERFLQLCGEDNMQVCNITSPANYFHALRRQLKRNFRKPLVIMTPKSLLRHKLCVSDLAEFGPDTKFRRVMRERGADVVPAKKAKRVVLCSGKVYYDLLQYRLDRGISDVHIIRLEQLYPFARQTLGRFLAEYRHAEFVWCQEEPANMGAWTFMLPRLYHLLRELDVKHSEPHYAGRPAAASTATGLFSVHKAQQEALVEQAMATPIDEIPQPFRAVTAYSHL